MLRQKKEGKHTALTSSETGRSSGKVVWFIPEKRFGFIKADAGDEILFLHHKFVQTSNFKAFEIGTPVEYIPYEGYLGLEAHEVRLIEPRSVSTENKHENR